VWTAALWANAVLLACCLIPFETPSQFSILDLPSDAMSLLKLWRTPQADPATAVATTALEAYVMREEGRLAAARALLEQEHARNPDAVVIANDLCVTMMLQDDAAAAVPMLRAQLEHDDQPSWLRPIVLNNLAYALSMLGDADSLAEAVVLIEAAIRLRGVHPFLLGTRACVFAQCGRADESVRLLDLVRGDHPDARTQAVRAGARGIALARLGRHDAARRELQRCSKLDPGGPWQRRLARLVEPVHGC
jgi:Flp pilus assembly protein TadD